MSEKLDRINGVWWKITPTGKVLATQAEVDAYRRSLKKTVGRRLRRPRPS